VPFHCSIALPAPVRELLVAGMARTLNRGRGIGLSDASTRNDSIWSLTQTQPHYCRTPVTSKQLFGHARTLPGALTYFVSGRRRCVCAGTSRASTGGRSRG